MSKTIAVIFTILCLCSAAATGLAGDFDGSKPLLCAVIDAVECGPGAKCEERTPDDINMPRFFRINFEKQTISSTKQSNVELSSKIEHMEHVDGQLILQGAEDALEDVRDGVGWTMTVSETTGATVLTAAGDQVGFVVFCHCTAD